MSLDPALPNVRSLLEGEVGLSYLADWSERLGIADLLVESRP